ncbi:hypothetical protein GCM10010483_14590 [Actinokineospora diospyrosa]
MPGKCEPTFRTTLYRYAMTARAIATGRLRRLVDVALEKVRAWRSDRWQQAQTGIEVRNTPAAAIQARKQYVEKPTVSRGGLLPMHTTNLAHRLQMPAGRPLGSAGREVPLASRS